MTRTFARFTLVSLTLAIAFQGHTQAGQWPQINIPTPGQVIEAVKKGGEDVGRAIEKAGKDVIKNGEKAVNDVGNNLGKGASDIGHTTTKALGDTYQTGRKALDDGVQETGRAVTNLLDAGKAVIHFAERQVQDKGKSLTSAEQRVREGKFVDAVWHMGIDPVQQGESNAAKAFQESSLLRTAGQVAASAYGGPGGAAAFAAWYTYHETGDPELAIKIGIITGVASAGFAEVNAMPSDQLVAKAILAGAIGGTAVAAAGGDKQAVQDAFLASGGMVLVQDGYQRVTTHKFDARGSKGDAYCVLTVGDQACTPEVVAYERDAAGNVVVDEAGDPKVDIRRTVRVDPRRPHVGLVAKRNDTGLASERGIFMKGVSRVPVMNTMAVFHDQWAISWNMQGVAVQATIVPAVVMTYIGTGDPVFERIRTAPKATDKSNGEQPAPDPDTDSVVRRIANSGPTRGLYEQVPFSSFVCSQDDVVRTIDVRQFVLQEETACEVSYVTERGASTPWRAERDRNFCAPYALRLAAKLDALRWSCVGR